MMEYFEIEPGRGTGLLDMDGNPLFDGDKVLSWNITHPYDPPEAWKLPLAEYKEKKVPVPCVVRRGEHDGREWWCIQTEGGGGTGLTNGAADPKYGVRKI